jgi:hypothetical protein
VSRTEKPNGPSNVRAHKSSERDRIDLRKAFEERARPTYP